MDKFLSVCLVLLIVPFALIANPSNEVATVNLAVMQGPTSISSSNLDSFINVNLFSSPDEAVAKLINGDVDFAVVPANLALNIYNKGVPVKFVAVVGEGMLSVIGTEESNEIAVPGLGGTPDHMQKLLYPQYEASYSVTAPAQVAQMLIANKIKMAILPQPFVGQVLEKNPSCRIISDVAQQWKKLTDCDQYPMSVLVARNSVDEKTIKDVKNSYRKSVSLVDEETAKQCALVFKDGKEAQIELFTYYKVLFDLAPQAIGSKLPDDGFWK